MSSLIKVNKDKQIHHNQADKIKSEKSTSFSFLCTVLKQRNNRDLLIDLFKINECNLFSALSKYSLLFFFRCKPLSPGLMFRFFSTVSLFCEVFFVFYDLPKLQIKALHTALHSIILLFCFFSECHWG